jgi:hypothetical protein
MIPSRLARGSAALAVVVLVTSWGSSASAADTANEVAPGVAYRSFELSTSHGPVLGHLVTADLRNAHVDLDLLGTNAVAARDEVSDMTNAQHAVAGVNGDFFNLSESHEGIAPTGAPVGPAIADSVERKAAVPDGQRFGPPMPAGTSTKDVFGLGTDRAARVSSLSLSGAAHTRFGVLDLEGLNQYALAVDGIGVYTPEWGTVSRARATCGTDTDRSAPCSTKTEQVTVRDGVVTAENDQPGSGAIPKGTMVLVGREKGADELERLQPGDRVTIASRLVPANVPPFEFAVGGSPMLRDGRPLTGLDMSTLAPRTAAGVSADGKTVYLVAIDGRSAVSSGLSVGELAALARSFGADDAVNLDGGGSTTMAVRDPGAEVATVKNTPSDGSERAVANGIGVFSTPDYLLQGTTLLTAWPLGVRRAGRSRHCSEGAFAPRFGSRRRHRLRRHDTSVPLGRYLGKYIGLDDVAAEDDPHDQREECGGLVADTAAAEIFNEALADLGVDVFAERNE